jgi:ATP-binding cassette subfamily B protein
VVGETAALLAVLFVITQLGGWYVVILFGTTVPAILIGLREGSLVYTWRKAWGKWYRYTDYFRHVVLLPPFVMEMRLFRLASHFIEQFWRSAQIFMRAYFWFEVRRQKLLAIKTLLPDLGYVCGFAALAHGVVRGTLTVGDGVLFIGAFKAAQVSLSTIAQAIGDLYESYLFITDLREFLQTSPRLVPSPTARVLQPDEPLTVEFRQVWFRYAADAPYILRDVSFILVPGQGVALIGENGAGKTTLIKLLLRFYDPSEGQILINGTDLRDIDLDSYYAKIGMIFQEPMRHEARVREQIGYGDLAALHDLERIRYAAQWGVPRRSLTNFLGGLKPIWAHGNWKSTRKSSPADNGNAWLWLAP